MFTSIALRHCHISKYRKRTFCSIKERSPRHYKYMSLRHTITRTIPIIYCYFMAPFASCSTA